MSGIAVTTLLNDGLFILLERADLPVLVAAIISSGVIAIVNYLMIDRLIFAANVAMPRRPHSSLFPSCPEMECRRYRTANVARA